MQSDVVKVRFYTLLCKIICYNNFYYIIHLITSILIVIYTYFYSLQSQRYFFCINYIYLYVFFSVLFINLFFTNLLYFFSSLVVLSSSPCLCLVVLCLLYVFLKLYISLLSLSSHLHNINFPFLSDYYCYYLRLFCSLSPVSILSTCQIEFNFQ